MSRSEKSFPFYNNARSSLFMYYVEEGGTPVIPPPDNTPSVHTRETCPNSLIKTTILNGEGGPFLPRIVAVGQPPPHAKGYTGSRGARRRKDGEYAGYQNYRESLLSIGSVYPPPLPPLKRCWPEQRDTGGRYEYLREQGVSGSL